MKAEIETTEHGVEIVLYAENSGDIALIHLVENETLKTNVYAKLPRLEQPLPENEKGYKSGKLIVELFTEKDTRPVAGELQSING